MCFFNDCDSSTVQYCKELLSFGTGGFCKHLTGSNTRMNKKNDFFSYVTIYPHTFDSPVAHLGTSQHSLLCCIFYNVFIVLWLLCFSSHQATTPNIWYKHEDKGRGSVSISTTSIAHLTEYVISQAGSITFQNAPIHDGFVFVHHSSRPHLAKISVH